MCAQAECARRQGGAVGQRAWDRERPTHPIDRGEEGDRDLHDRDREEEGERDKHRGALDLHPNILLLREAVEPLGVERAEDDDGGRFERVVGDPLVREAEMVEEGKSSLLVGRHVGDNEEGEPDEVGGEVGALGE